MYDRLYADTQYEEDCDLVQSIAISPSEVAPAILDLGCGTGSHALALAARGFVVTGVDRSEAMIDQARRKAAQRNVSLTFQVGDVTDVRVPATFDVVTFMFAVLGYLVEADQLEAALSTARHHLTPGGRLIFDVWYGPTVLMEGPQPRLREIRQPNGSIIRAVDPVLRTEKNVVDVHTRIVEIRADRLVSNSAEVHSVRYFFVPEIDDLLRRTSFRADQFFAFPVPDAPLGPGVWNMGCAATAV